jgi:nitrite reductase/ring-hydroxylating ferredoxin subunit
VDVDGWTRVLATTELPEEELTRVEVDGVSVLLYRKGGSVFAIAGRCTHVGMPLDRGRVQGAGDEAIVTCPAHGSQFRLADGRVVRPPARESLTTYEARVLDDGVDIRPTH